MVKVLLLIIFGVAIYKMFRTYKKMLDKQAQDEPKKLEDMVRCSHCGVYVPRSEGFLSQEKYYCSKEHLEAHS